MELSPLSTRLLLLAVLGLGVASVVLVGVTAGVDVLDFLRFLLAGLFTAGAWAAIGPRLPQWFGAGVIGVTAAVLWAIALWPAEAFEPLHVLVGSACAGVISGSLAAAAWERLQRLRLRGPE